MPVRFAIAFFLLTTITTTGSGADPVDDDFFEKRIRPVLVQHCQSCHSAAAIKGPKGGLKVDSRAALLTGGDSGPSIVPDHPEKSRLIEAIGYQNPDLQMPPMGKLPAAVIADLTAWVKAGAKWPSTVATNTEVARQPAFDLLKRKAEHWAWQPLRDAKAPSVKNTNWATSDIDRFVLAKLENKGMTPAPDADPEAILRRLSYDLLGLPPRPEEVTRFVQLAKSRSLSEALRVQVDLYLQSPHYGERWARHWLDLMRYAESKGHEFDNTTPNAYLYRDYVIQSFNSEKPYSQFVTEQIAGDLMPASGLNVAATAWWFLGEEVHSPVDIRQDQADRFDNRIDVFGKAFLGLTVACARCHDHKFDAISAKDYAALFAILESSGQRLAPLNDTQNDRERANDLTRIRGTNANTVSRGRLPNAIVDYANTTSEEWIVDGPAFGSRAMRVGEFQFLQKNDTTEALVMTRSAAVFDRGLDPPKPLPGTAGEPGKLGSIRRAGRTLRTPSFTITKPKVFVFIRGAGTAYAAVSQHALISGPLHNKLIVGMQKSEEFRWVPIDVSVYQGLTAHVELIPGEDTEFAVAAVVQGDETPALPPSEDVPDIHCNVEAALAAHAQLRSAKPRATHAINAMWDGTAVEGRVFVRGSHKVLGEKVPRRFLEAIAGPGPIPAKTGSGRYELAKQMVNPALNPLLPRVMVNRVWHHLFGRGIVASTDNFGVMGDSPTHPELLDYLANRFVAQGWSVKSLIRDIVLSRAYSMASSNNTTAEMLDPKNEWHHRANIRRIDADSIRDTMLAISGELDRTILGPPIPAYITEYQDGRGKPGKSGPLNGKGRRTIYLEIRRNFVSPFLLAFDFPNPAGPIGQRTVSNVPAQSLILLNDPFVRGQAQAWGKRCMEGAGDDKSKIRQMYLSAFGRSASDVEVATCLTFKNNLGNTAEAWVELAHALMLTQEFLYLK